MTFSLPPELSAFIDQSVATGRFATPDEVVATALRRMQDDERDLRQKLQEGIDALDRGEYTAINSEEELEEFFQDIRRLGMERLKANS